MKPKVGEIWIVTIPILITNNEDTINVSLQKRPVLILDDGRGLVVEEDNRNLHVLKLTTQDDPYKRILIDNWKEIGLKYKSYIRIEMPIKLEKNQFICKIADLPEEQLLKMYHEIYKILNINALEKMSKKYEEENETQKA